MVIQKVDVRDIAILDGTERLDRSGLTPGIDCQRSKYPVRQATAYLHGRSLVQLVICGASRLRSGLDSETASTRMYVLSVRTKVLPYRLGQKEMRQVAIFLEP